MAGNGKRTVELCDRSVLALNRGSSTIKFGLFTFEAQPRVLCRETIDASDRQTAAFARLLEGLTPQLRQYPLAAVMSTRTGDLDPGVVTHIARLRGCSADRLEDELSHRSGLAALSGGASDMRALLEREASDVRSRLAVAIYCYEIKKRIGAYAAALGGLDALVFSGGIGEHAAPVRSKICTGLGFLGIEMDETANAANLPLVSSARSRVGVHVIGTDEEGVMARAAYRVLHKRI